MSIRKGEVDNSAPNVAAHLAVGPAGLPDNVKFVRRDDGSVWRVETLPKAKTGPDRTENRVDSIKDRDIIAKGGTVWYEQYIVSDEPVEETKAPVKETPKKKGKNS